MKKWLLQLICKIKGHDRHKEDTKVSNYQLLTASNDTTYINDCRRCGDRVYFQGH